MKIYNNIINMNNKPYNWYSNQTVQTHGLNAKIVFEKYAPSPEISAKMCQIFVVIMIMILFYLYIGYLIS